MNIEKSVFEEKREIKSECHLDSADIEIYQDEITLNDWMGNPYQRILKYKYVVIRGKNNTLGDNIEIRINSDLTVQIREVGEE